MNLKVYHIVPAKVAGDKLYPLNELANHHREHYDKQVAKYKGRESLLERKILPLNCLWNDVLHFTAIPPRSVRSALEVLGFPYPQTFYAVDPVAAGFTKDNSVIFTPPKDCRPFDLNALPMCQAYPSETLAYFQKMRDEGKRPLLYAHVPHFLFKGTLDVSAPNVELVKA